MAITRSQTATTVHSTLSKDESTRKIIKTATAEKVKTLSNGRNTRVKARVKAKVVSVEEAPVWMQQDPFIKHGYRKPVYSYQECLRSLFYLHNEFVNTWSHLLPAAVFLMILLIADQRTFSNGIKTSPSDFIAMQTYVAGTAACLILSVSLHGKAAQDVFSINICKAMFHGANSHSPDVARLLLKLDYCGIILTISTTCISATYFGLYGRPDIQALYISLTSLSAFGVLWVVLDPTVDGHKAAGFR